MWETIHTNDEILKFMESVCHFHDSCIKEISYISGAYVSENLSMHPLNVRRVLRVVIQRQYEKDSMIEMEFQGLKHLKLFPVDESYTCEILDSTMIMKDGNFYWCDCGNVSESDLDDYAGTFIFTYVYGILSGFYECPSKYRKDNAAFCYIHCLPLCQCTL